MRTIIKLSYLILLTGFISFFTACSDEPINLNGADENLSDVPDEIKEGFSISFKMSLDPMGGQEPITLTRAGFTNTDLREIENFIDMEKLRVLFFTCDVEKDENGNFIVDNTGTKDIFLFESKSRWVSQLTVNESTNNEWQVTAPVFTYGNNDEYDWEYVRERLTTYPFKIAVLANRPDQIRYSDFDEAYKDELENTQDGFYYGNRGPYWGVNESNDRSKTINELHHCQWDPVYANKNQKADQGYMFYFYNFLMQDPGELGDLHNQNKNWMGAVSAWTEWKWDEEKKDWERDGTDKNKPVNYYILPSKDKQAIPMYGVQRFEPLKDWKPGTPFNVSVRKAGQDASYEGKNINMLRSLVRLELIIPKDLGFTIEKPCLEYSNVFGRCEPLDVSTPTEQIWAEQHSNGCEWNNLLNYGPIINGDLGKTDNNKNNPAAVKTLKEKFLARMAWFYGAWKDWWHFNGELTKNDSRFDEYANGMPYPRIFNPCIQRNGSARLDKVEMNEAGYYHYVVYTGERNINDPSNFYNLNKDGSEIAYFKFTAVNNQTKQGKDYYVALTNYKNENQIDNELIKNYLSGGLQDLKGYRTEMAGDINPYNWNWPLLRNHTYIYRINAINDKSTGGIDVAVIDSEDRFSPDLNYY